MAWTTPMSWPHAYVPDHDDFNEQVRDNMLVLKTSIDDNGKLRALSAAYVADLSGLNLTGVVKLASDNLFTGGTHDFSAATVRVPVGADKYDGAPGNKTPGSLWVEGDHLHYVDDDRNEHRYVGTLVHTDAAAPSGFIWQEGATGDLHYVDEAGGDERSFTPVGGAHVDAPARAGSLWVDSDDRLHIVGTSGVEYDLHADTHGDAAHGDSSAHTDSHTDTAHADVAHGDTAHSDAGHSDSHFDTAHTDVTHNDQHTDAHDDTHNDAAHADGHTDGHADHTDFGHADTHQDTHDDTGHFDTHDDSHTDLHVDMGHNDVPHDDAHNDSHGDTSHSDTSHSDVAHVDSHTDVSHDDSAHADAHSDQPEFVGP
jgi:hypothetical protein